VRRGCRALALPGASPGALTLKRQRRAASMLEKYRRRAAQLAKGVAPGEDCAGNDAPRVHAGMG
jgi:predicted membrane protein